jgi:hypothetical protein
VDLPVYYPTNDLGPLMKGMLIGGVAIFHVFVAQFAVGGGFLLLWFEWLNRRGDRPLLRRFVSGYFKWLVLISFVVGALSGVGIWLTSIQVSPRTIGLMVEEFHWVWATEWLFFSLEVVAGYAFYRYGERLGHARRMQLLTLYSISAAMSLWWINGILSWQLTPGTWPESGALWAGFFNPSFWPSLVFRLMVCLTLAALVACAVISFMPDLEKSQRVALQREAAWLLTPMAVMPFVGLWFLATIPADSRGWLTGGSIAMTMFLSLAAGASTLLGVYVLQGIARGRFHVNLPTSLLLLGLAFGATAGGEFVREGSRKPYTVRRTLYANSITPAEVETLREVGSVTHDPYPLRDGVKMPSEEVERGARVFRFQCSVCHTVNGANGVEHLAGRAPGGDVVGGAAAHERGEAADDQAVHAAVRRERGGRRGAGAVAALAPRRRAGHVAPRGGSRGGPGPHPPVAPGRRHRARAAPQHGLRDG